MNNLQPIHDHDVPRFNLPQRPRRNRATAAIRDLHRGTWLAPQHLVYPLFIHAGADDQPIPAMPGCSRLGPEGLLREVEGALADGIRTVILFPAIPETLKTPDAAHAWHPDDIVPQTIQQLRERWPELTICSDVALDPYSSDGHDGLLAPDGRILNDETVALLCRQALVHAEAGVSIVAPSDMMDGRVGAIRQALDAHSYQEVAILAYTAKYASGFYGPFRAALDSAPRHGDKKTYQMDPANRREAVRELRLDEAEGADMVMVKPAGPYLDVIRDLREQTPLPVAAYQVSGEYAMLKAAAERGWLDERTVVLESLLGIRRAGADVILTYFARQAARWLRT
ncbi:MAG: porphobilinogen synthase [Chloroflexales bacterium]|nr:porphobilinogen synthase [Chloroflexales bacterium]